MARQATKTKTNTKSEIHMTYSSTMAVSRQRYTTRNQNAVAFRAENRRLGPISNTVVLIVLACLLGLLYLTQVTKTNTFGYTIDKLESQHAALIDQRQDLQLATGRLQSTSRIQASEQAKQLVAVAPATVVQQ